MKYRLENIECWKCEKEFDFTKEIDETDSISTHCAFCYAENVIELEPHRKTLETAFRGSEDTDSVDTGDYDFPDTLQGKKPPDKED